MSGSQTGSSTSSGWGSRLEDWFKNGWPAAVALAGTLAIGVATAPELIEGTAQGAGARSFEIGNWGWPQVVFLAGLAALLASTVGQFVLAPSANRMSAEKDAADLRALQSARASEGLLKAIATDLEKGLGLDRAHARVSIYSHVDARFVLLARVSVNPTFVKRGRSHYPEDQGVIGQAWELGSKVLVGLEEDRSEWEKQLIESHNIPPAVVAALKMQSRSLVAKRVESPGDHRQIGMLVLESTKPRGVSSTTLDQISDIAAWSILRHALATSEADLPVAAVILGQAHFEVPAQE